MVDKKVKKEEKQPHTGTGIPEGKSKSQGRYGTSTGSNFSVAVPYTKYRYGMSSQDGCKG